MRNVLRKLLCAALLGVCCAAPASAADGGAASKQDLRWHLTGVIIGPHVTRRCLAPTRNPVVLPGGRLDGWTLTDIRPGSVTLRRPGEEKRLGADEWLPDDARAADSLRRMQQFEAQRAAAAALEQQRQDEAKPRPR